MENLAEKYFDSLYLYCNEPIICCDKNTRIVYISDMAYSFFGINKSKNMYLNCIFQQKYLSEITAYIERKVAFSMEFITADGKERDKFFAMPILIQDKYYTSFAFTKLEYEKIDNLGKYDFVKTIHATNNRFYKISSNSLVNLVNMSNGARTDSQININIKYALEMQRIFNELEILATDTSKTARYQTVEVNSAIESVVNDILSNLYSDKIRIEVNPDSDFIRTPIDPNVFQILMCNIIAGAAANTLGKLRLTIDIKKLEGYVKIVVSEHGIRHLDMSDFYKRPDNPLDYNSSEYFNVSAAVVRKIIWDHKGSIGVAPLPNEGTSVAFTLPIVYGNKTILEEPIPFLMQDEFFTLTRMFISSILDLNDIENIIKNTDRKVIEEYISKERLQ